METFDTLNNRKANQLHIETHGAILNGEVDLVNHVISLIEERYILNPVKGDRIYLCNEKGDPIYKNAHLNEEYTKEYASICMRQMEGKNANAPWVFYDKNSISSFSCSGGPWTTETEREMYEYVCKEKKLFCIWGFCGVAPAGAIYFYATVNAWKICREDF